METNLQSQFLPIVNEVNEQAIYLDEDELTYKISNYDELKSRLEQLQQSSENYIYNEDDRQDVKKFKAEINKFEKKIRKKIKEEQTQLFGNVDASKKELVTLLNSIKSNIETGIIEEDKRYREAKDTALREIFDEAKDAYDHFKESDFTYDDISIKKWLNRSKSESSVIAEMNDRINTLDALLTELKEINRVTTDKDLILHTLNKQKWNSLATLNDLKTQFDEEDARLERKLREKEERERKQQEKQEQERLKKQYEEEHVVETASIIIAKKDLKRVKDTLDRLNISYELGD